MLTRPTSSWVTVTELKNDQTLDTQLGTQDEALQRVLEAAMVWVENRRDDLDYLGPWTVPADVRLGTLRLAARWFIRRISPDGLVNLGDLGSGRVMEVDPDIRVQLGILGGLS
jgi:hypothetical protein